MINLVAIRPSFPDSSEILSTYIERYSPYSLSRYKRIKVILEDKFLYKTLSKENMVVKANSNVSYVVKASDKNRLDLISMKFYGTPLLYWAIAYLNDVMDPFDVPTGTVLDIPSKADLYISGGPLS